jgi:hypothetical protein
MSHTKAAIITCIDFRFQKFMEDWARSFIGTDQYDHIAYPGGIKKIDIILNLIDVSVKLHGINEAYLINHEDCGAYSDNDFTCH